MSPKFSLGVALGFAAAVAWTKKPWQHKPRQAAAPPPLQPPLAARVAAVESQLDQADRAILEHSKALAARAFQPSRAPSKAALAGQLASADRKVQAFRQELDEWVAASRDAASGLRGKLEAWRHELPALVETGLQAAAHHDEPAEAPDLDLPQPPSAPENPSPTPAPVREAVAERLLRLRAETERLAAKAAALRTRLTPPPPL